MSLQSFSPCSGKFLLILVGIFSVSRLQDLPQLHVRKRLQRLDIVSGHVKVY